MQAVFFCCSKIEVIHWLFQEGSDNEEEEGEEEEEENTDYLTDSNKENETDEENTVCIVALDKWIDFRILVFTECVLPMPLITYVGKHGKNTPCYSFKYILEFFLFLQTFIITFWKYLRCQLYYNMFS